MKPYALCREPVAFHLGFCLLGSTLAASLMCKKQFYLQTHLVHLEIGLRNGVAERLGMECLIMLATLRTVCFPFVGFNHKIVKRFVFVLLFFHAF